MNRLATLLFLLLPAFACAELKIAGAVKVEQYKLVRLTAEGADAKSGLIWRVSPTKLIDKATTVKGRLEFTGPPGDYDVSLLALKLSASGEVEIEEAAVVVTIGGVPPGPGPGPGPAPGPGPGPGPGPQPPKPTTGYDRVLVLYESADLPKMPAQQQNILYGMATRDYLKAHTLKDADNPNGAWRLWDKDVDASNEAKPWQTLLARPRAGVPWVILAAGPNADVVYEGVLPANPKEFQELLAKYEKPVQKKKAG